MNHFCHLKDESSKLSELRWKHIEPNNHSIEIADRILKAYHRAISFYPEIPDDQWKSIVGSDLSELTLLLNEKDPSKLAFYLQHYGEQFIGFGGFSLGHDGYYLNQKELAPLYKDKFLCLAEAIGVLPLENPEQGERKNSFYSIPDVIDKIEKKMGIDVFPPQVSYVLGLDTPKGVLHYRHINALYTAWKVSTLVKKADSVCEIGGGLGLIALYARRFGISDYVLLDLPIGNVFSANFLIHALGGDSVSLFGEKENGSKIKIRPFWHHEFFGKDVFHLTLNQDGFPEMSEQVVRSYFDSIARNTSTYFLSINQEAQKLKVSQLLDGDRRFRRIERSKYWIREGYVEELYEVMK